MFFNNWNSPTDDERELILEMIGYFRDNYRIQVWNTKHQHAIAFNIPPEKLCELIVVPAVLKVIKRAALGDADSRKMFGGPTLTRGAIDIWRNNYLKQYHSKDKVIITDSSTESMNVARIQLPKGLDIAGRVTLSENAYLIEKKDFHSGSQFGMAAPQSCLIIKNSDLEALIMAAFHLFSDGRQPRGGPTLETVKGRDFMRKISQVILTINDVEDEWMAVWLFPTQFTQSIAAWDSTGIANNAGEGPMINHDNAGTPREISLSQNRSQDAEQYLGKRMTKIRYDFKNKVSIHHLEPFQPNGIEIPGITASQFYREWERPTAEEITKVNNMFDALAKLGIVAFSNNAHHYLMVFLEFQPQGGSRKLMTTEMFTSLLQNESVWKQLKPILEKASRPDKVNTLEQWKDNYIEQHPSAVYQGAFGQEMLQQALTLFKEQRVLVLSIVVVLLAILIYCYIR
jgi:hypothetical protein